MARKSLLPAAGENLFQRVKKQSAEAQSRGIELTKLSIGQPSGPALIEACIAAAAAIQSREERMHEYQDNGSPGVPDFARRFAKAHVKTDLSAIGDDRISFLPVPGVKPMLGIVINSLGAWVKGRRCAFVGTMTKPGYPTPRDQTEMAKNIGQFELPMDPAKGFLFSPDEIDSASNLTASSLLGEGDMLMLNFPHNPAGIVAKREWLKTICAYCEQRGIRLFNDAAYTILANSPDAVTLTDVAVNYPDLNWVEAFSASKSGNNTGWRIGAMVGSPEFIGDVARIKGNTDSGFAAPLAAGMIELYEKYPDKIDECRRTYASRLTHLTRILTERGFRVAVPSEAGFFILCDCPNRAFKTEFADAEQFNKAMIDETGIVGVPFEGKYIRYAVCATDTFAVEGKLKDAFEKADVAYNSN